MPGLLRRNWPLVLPVVVAAPGVWLKLSGADPAAVVAMLIYAAAVIGAAFFLSWGTELAERDIGQGLALALLALIAVLPEYAVDTVFAWKAGKNPEQFAPLALANMTGANRLLIGVGWSLVALVSLWARRRNGSNRSDDPDRNLVRLEPVQTVEIAYLAVASLYSLTFALRTSITVLDTLVLFGLFVLYLIRVQKVEIDEEEEEEEGELVGPAARIATGPARTRRWVAVAMLVFAGGVILAVAEAFATSLVATGQQLGVSQFLLVQWVAPFASETPEFVAVLILAWKMRGAAALGALISSKINQWTLLVGILPLVFAVSAGSLTGLPIDALQREELFLTAAQSVFAVALVLGGYLSRRGAYALLGLFVAQFALAWTLPPQFAAGERIGLGFIYLVLAAAVVVAKRRGAWVNLRDGIRGAVSSRELDEGPRS